LRIKVARIFNTFVQALLGKDVTIYGDGHQSRSFCYVDDLIDGLIRLMQAPDDTIGPINLGNPQEFTILQLASMVIDLAGSHSPIVYRPRPEDDPRQRRPDISKAQDLLSWQPRTPLKQGLVRTIEYFEKLLSDRGVQAALLNNYSS
jgi:UDP-glucuronate decarboxylase